MNLRRRELRKSLFCACLAPAVQRQQQRRRRRAPCAPRHCWHEARNTSEAAMHGPRSAIFEPTQARVPGRSSIVRRRRIHSCRACTCVPGTPSWRPASGQATKAVATALTVEAAAAAMAAKAATVQAAGLRRKMAHSRRQ